MSYKYVVFYLTFPILNWYFIREKLYFMFHTSESKEPAINEN